MANSSKKPLTVLGGIIVSVLLGFSTFATTAQASDTPEAVKPESPVHFDAILTTDWMSVSKGGASQSGRGFGNLDLTASYKGQNGWEAFGYVIADAQGGFTGNSVGDAQGVSNIDAMPVVRLFEAWVRKTSPDQRHVSTLGLINLNSIFDLQSVGGVFLNASHGIGPDFSQTTPSIFPISGLGWVEEFRPSDGFAMRVGVFDGLAGDEDHLSAFSKVELSSQDGAMWVVEAEKSFKNTTVKIGHWHYTKTADRFDGLGRDERAGSYGQVATTLWSDPKHEDRSLKAWVRTGFSNDKVLNYDHYVGGGVTFTGLFANRPSDVAGLALAQAHFGAPYMTANPQVWNTETTVELTYQAQIKPGLVIQPDYQFVRHPSGQLRDAHVIGVRLRVGLEAFKRE